MYSRVHKDSKSGSLKDVARWILGDCSCCPRLTIDLSFLFFPHELKMPPAITQPAVAGGNP